MKAVSRKLTILIFILLFGPNFSLAGSEAEKSEFSGLIEEIKSRNIDLEEALEKECQEECDGSADCLKNCLTSRITQELISLLGEKCSGSVKENVFFSLLVIGRHSIRPLIEAIENNNSDCVQMTAMEVLAELGPEAKEAEKALAKKLASSANSSEAIRISAIKTLEKIGPGYGSFSELIKTLESSSEETRKYSAIVLGRMGPLGLDSVPKLSRLAVGDESLSVRKAAISAIGNIGPRAKTAYSVLIVLMNNREEAEKDWTLPLYAAKSLLQINPADRSPASKIIFSIDSEKENDFACELLLKLGETVKPDIESLLSMKSLDSKLRSKLDFLLKKINEKSRGPNL
ncbi:MAG: HEAT repeat domain-containing protein [bacterium]|nr:HEAT repeat domain-containing protein [bacterium]